MSQQGYPDFARLGQVVGPPLVNVVNLAMTGAYTSAIFPVGMYDTLECWVGPLSGTTNYRFTIIWWDALSGGATLGGTSQYHTVNGAPIRVAVPVAALYAQIQMEAFSYATSPIVSVRVFPRVGVPPPATGTVEGQLFSNVGQFVAAGGVAAFVAFRVVSGNAEIMGISDTGNIKMYLAYYLYDGTTKYFCAVESGGGVTFQSRMIKMPQCLLVAILINQAAVAATLYASLTMCSGV